MIRTGWRPLTAADLDRVNEIADAVHLDFPERAEVPAERLRLFPAGCFAAIAFGTLLPLMVCSQEFLP